MQVNSIGQPPDADTIRSSLVVEVGGSALPDDRRREIHSSITAMVAAELAESARGVLAEQVKVIAKADHDLRRRPENEISVALRLGDLHLPPANVRRLEHDIRSVIYEAIARPLDDGETTRQPEDRADELPSQVERPPEDDALGAVPSGVRSGTGAAGVPSAVCVCTAYRYGDRIPVETAADPEGRPLLQNGLPPWRPVWRGQSPTEDYWLIAVYLNNTGSDTAVLLLRNGARESVGPNEVLIGLANNTPWAKEIWAYNYCVGRQVSVVTDGNTRAYNYMRLQKGQCREGTHAIVFRKPGFLGWWFDIGHIELSRFWEFFGGNICKFTWQTG
jgi:hypothetical protein